MAKSAVGKSWAFGIDWLMPGVLFAGGLGLAALLLIADVVNGAMFLAVPLLGLVGVGWIVTLLMVSTFRRSRLKRVWTWLFLAGVPGMVIGALILSGFDVPLRLAVAHDRAALDALAAEVMALPEGGKVAGRRVGAFEATDIHRFPGGMCFRAELGNPFDWNGLAFFPDGRPVELDGYHFGEHLAGNWYWCYLERSPFPDNAASKPRR